MEILPVSEIRVDKSKIESIKEILRSTLLLITFSRDHLADDLLNTYLNSTTNLQDYSFSKIQLTMFFLIRFKQMGSLARKTYWILEEQQLKINI